VFVNEIGNPPHDLGPSAPRQFGPDARFEGRLRAGDGLVDRVFSAVGELGDLLLGHGIDDLNDVA